MNQLATPLPAQPEIPFRSRRPFATTVCVAALFLLVTGLAGHMFRPSPLDPGSLRAAEVARLELMTQGAQAEIIGSGDNAEERNKLIPIAGLAGGTVAPFHAIAAGSEAYAVARKCLTQAIYYEAANEPIAGKRAVAQVVLNRVRHPAYPKSVCGVVYQGWNQTTCQFTFVCDGALLRAPMRTKWQEAEEIATEALAGTTEQAVGSATNYHADYVLPRWAFTLPKVAQIGAHIFYRMPGRWGSSQALTARWDGSEAIPRMDLNALRLKLAAQSIDADLAPVQLVPGLTVTPLASDRHAPQDVGGRIDMTKTWRPSMPLPADLRSASSQAPIEAIPAGTSSQADATS
jgi:spore germination cell wall hydrolase CwlJ-like protein